jgi:DNA-directed RNA polymerase specialized sigma24 family protein
MDSSVSPTWDAVATNYLKGEVDLSVLYKAAKKPLERIVARLAPSMPADLREDAVQQIFLRLIENPPKHDADRCSSRTLMYGLGRNAVKQVRAMSAPPGRKTRLSWNENAQDCQVPSTDVTPGLAIVEDAAQEIEGIPSPRWTAKNVETSARTRELLGQFPQDVAAAVWLVFGLEFSIIEAGRILRKSRFAVARSLHQARRAA